MNDTTQRTAQSEVKICRHPDCVDHVTDTYVGRDGNELDLCGEHYFRAVYPVPNTVVNRVRRKKRAEEAGGLTHAFLGFFK